MLPLKSDRIILQDGRRLGYGEIGDPGGKPIFYFHGFPGSRLEIELVSPFLAEANLRIIALERPGYGLSDFKKERTIGQWPDDVLELAEALGLERFAVLGISGGGPYALACAWKIPHRLTSAVIVCGMGLVDTPEMLPRMIWVNRFGLTLAGKSAFLSDGLFALATIMIRRFPEKIIAHLLKRVSAPDKKVLNQEVRQVLIQSFREAVKAGHRGPARDAVLYSRPWDFRVEDIRMEVDLFYGEEDTIVPSAAGRWLEKIIPRCRARYFPQEGHFSLILNQRQEIIEKLTGC
ncbi:MAG: alpha/beta hydrolase [Desulfobacca sp.]|nr:alpha/beta hydrolase [Desulfobacca sp.]